MEAETILDEVSEAVLFQYAYSFVVMAMVIHKAVKIQHFSISYSDVLIPKFSYTQSFQHVSLIWLCG